MLDLMTDRRSAHGRDALHPHVLEALEQDEDIHAVVHLPDATVILSGRRLMVARSDRMALIVPIEAVRRIQFDVEKLIPSVMVIVPDHPSHEPQVLTVPADSLRDATDLLALVGDRLAGVKPGP
jgi:hypothetical protein